jgi:hypothetical protein
MSRCTVPLGALKAVFLAGLVQPRVRLLPLSDIVGKRETDDVFR